MSRQRTISLGFVLCGMLAFAALPARGATTMYLKAEGIKGESTDKVHKEWIEVLSFSTGVTQSGSAHAGGGAGAGKATVQPFVVTKLVDASSPQFFLSACNGKHLKEVVLEVVRAGETQQPILKYTLNDVIVSSVQTNATSGQDRPTEQISFDYAKISMTVFGSDAKGGGKAVGDFTWDLKTNKGASSGGGSPDGSAAAAATAAPDSGAGGAAPAGAAPAGTAAAGTPAGGAGAAAPAAGTGDAATAQPAKPLTRAQRERLKLRQAGEAQPAPAPAPK
jgi:type VI secretion system secreted protein Hcp